MIRLISLFFMLILCFKCNIIKAEKSSSGRAKITIPSNSQEEKLFVFSESIRFCDNNIGYFTDKEANNLYSDKNIKVDIMKAESFERDDSIISEELIDCITIELKVSVKENIKIIRTGLEFPFNKLYLVDKKYIMVVRDGCFFVFLENI